MKIFFTVITLLITLLADLLIGNLGFAVSITTCVLIYLTGVAGREITFPAAIIAGMFLDMCYARPAAFSAAVLLAAVIIGSSLIPDREQRFMLFRSLPAGAAAAGVFVLGNALAVSCLYGKTGYPSTVMAHLVSSMLAALVFFPLLVIVLDAVASKIGLQGYLSKIPADINPEIPQETRLPIETASERRRKR